MRINVAVSLQTIVLLIVAFAFPWNAEAQNSTIRLHAVNIPVDSGLLADVLPEFEKATGYSVEITKSEDVYTFARQGMADLVLSHYGHADVDDFMADELGLWPRVVFNSHFVLLGPASDPAGIRGLQDATEAFRRIAQTKSRFVVDNAATDKYIIEMLWQAAGRPDRTGWYIDSGLRDQQAIQSAQMSNAYAVWGTVPFLRFKEMSNSTLEAFVTDDPLLRRSMMTVIVNPEKVSGINVAGALSLQRFLASPAAQAQIRTSKLFSPAALDNIGTFLSDTSPLTTAADPAVTNIVITLSTVRPGESLIATFSGANLSPATYFDVRFRRPGATTDETASNWQQGTSARHAVPSGTPNGVWRITAVRAHSAENDHSTSFIPVSATISIAP